MVKYSNWGLSYYGKIDRSYGGFIRVYAISTLNIIFRQIDFVDAVVKSQIVMFSSLLLLSAGYNLMRLIRRADVCHDLELFDSFINTLIDAKLEENVFQGRQVVVR